jgi:hypothetical protein
MADIEFDAYFDEYERCARERRERRRAPRNGRRRPRPRVPAAWLDGRLLLGLAVALAAGTAIAMVLLWPTGSVPHLNSAPAASRGAHVLSVREARCTSATVGACRWATVSGEPALEVALVASLAVMFVTLALTSGLGPRRSRLHWASARRCC